MSSRRVRTAMPRLTKKSSLLRSSAGVGVAGGAVWLSWETRGRVLFRLSSGWRWEEEEEGVWWRIIGLSLDWRTVVVERLGRI